MTSTIKRQKVAAACFACQKVKSKCEVRSKIGAWVIELELELIQSNGIQANYLWVEVSAHVWFDVGQKAKIIT
jgi:hypothetical protein